MIETCYLAYICISRSSTFWGVICHGQSHLLGSKVKSIGQIAHFNIGNNFWSNRDRHLIFGVHMYLMKTHILSGNMSRSRSFFKVNSQNFSFSHCNFNIGHMFLTSSDRNLIHVLCIHMYLKKPHILRGNMLRSRSSFKVKDKI